MCANYPIYRYSLHPCVWINWSKLKKPCNRCLSLVQVCVPLSLLYHKLLRYQMYRDSAFLPYLEDLPPIAREDEGPLRMPIADKFKVDNVFPFH